ncbi:ectoine/hydroxyectoine ABC transporter substrate-binding protein EhuB [Bosea sp. (in: a-proteobacteria)]|uniref:ectoine/hydroxyectoine ABC transporter substrate-binding protein EhuB n=1 Tax=Bosea sp. (in: a-proteobacteria) TaxID=1871050 RepID=UPI00261E0B56|nr:ectoine/hydroxyectoine ABC transporter substrate-binding protein EhuB [Bosea sp. (in: a-proteobacteria)]MCO5089533.1 ectoine/hydroxyectoine ABC transporter substrate-binding protein EhuB [Bosea sp. (in: a-proteobacteria)]
MITRRKTIFAAAALLSAGFALAANAQSTLDRARQDGFLRVGFPNQVPYAYANERGQLTGADAAVARLVVKKMGIAEMDGVLTEFASLIPGLKAKRFDVVLAMFVNPQRCAQVFFSEPIYKIGQAIAVRQGNPKKVTGWNDLVSRDDVKLAIMAGAVQASYLKKLGVADARVSAFPDGPSAMAAVATGRADAFAISDLPARRLVEAMGASGGVELVKGVADPTIDGRPGRGYSAFAFRPEDESLRVAFNAALAEVKKSDEFLAAMTPFGFTKENLPDLTTAELCR